MSGIPNPHDIYEGFQDHERFCREALFVEAENKETIPMAMGPGQLRLHAAIAKQREDEQPVRILYLKSRRIQATTGTAAEFFHHTAFNAGVHTVVLAHDTTSVQNIFRIYKRFHDRYRPFGGVIRLPESKPLSDRIYYEYGGDPESSFIQIHTAGSVNFGRSFRITNVHFSEFPYYERPGEVLASVMSAVPKLPDTCVVVEGTAKTIGDDFHRMWQASQDPSSESEWLGLFMGWHEHPSNKMPLDISVERFGNSLSKEEREMQQQYRLSLEQLRWRRYTIANDFNGDTQRFRREHPATPEDAFTAASRNRFSIPHIQRMPIQRDPMIGELQLEQVGIEKKLIFLPGERGAGALRIWRRPEKGRLYAVGADCAQGIDVTEGDGEADPDYSAAHVLDRDTGEQCAVLHARMMPGETGRYVAALGKYYNMAQICGEINPGGGGVSMLEAIMNADYPRALLYHRPVAADQDPQVRSDKLGWDTSGVSRPVLISLLDDLIRQDALSIHDPLTQQELLTFVIKKTGKAEHQSGCHDDLVIALALTCVVITRMQRPVIVAPIGPHHGRPQVQKYGGRVEQPGRRERRF